ncbi:hypothetical protein FRX31_026092, partial [Thalictrum thalictroides]
KERLELAHVCVEVPCDHQFESSIKLNNGGSVALVGVEYPWKPPSCTICKCFGHKTDKCSKAPPKVWVEKQGRRRVNNNDSEEGPLGLKNGEGLQGQEVVGMDQVPDIEIVLDTPPSQAHVVAPDNRENELISAPQVEGDIQQYEKEKEFFLEYQADSEEEIDSVEDDKEP